LSRQIAFCQITFLSNGFLSNRLFVKLFCCQIAFVLLEKNRPLEKENLVNEKKLMFGVTPYLANRTDGQERLTGGG
jgi:hypothetical protein